MFDRMDALTRFLILNVAYWLAMTFWLGGM